MRCSRTGYKAIDVFAGAGGLTQGLKQAGFNVVGAVEINELAVETYRVNHPSVRIWQQDICKLSGANIGRALRLGKGELDLLAGCPPCQGFSSMRTMNGGREIRDVRNDLVFQLIRLVKEMEPKTIMMENVPGLAGDKRMDRIRRCLLKMGYTSECRVLDAADYEVPQRRRRMILLASRGGLLRAALPRTGTRTVYDAIHDLPLAGSSGDPLHDYPEHRSDEVMNRIRDIPLDGW